MNIRSMSLTVLPVVPLFAGAALAAETLSLVDAAKQGDRAGRACC